MGDDAQHLQRLVDGVQRLLPLTAHPRSALKESIRKSHPHAPFNSVFTVTSVFNAGTEFGIMCHLELRCATSYSSTIVASIPQANFDGRHLISRELAAYRRYRLGMPFLGQRTSFSALPRRQTLK